MVRNQDFFACIVAMRIDRGPPFSALFTLWLSIIATVGLRWTPSIGQETGRVKRDPRRLHPPLPVRGDNEFYTTFSRVIESFSCWCCAGGDVVNALALSTYPWACAASKISRGVR